MDLLQSMTRLVKEVNIVVPRHSNLRARTTNTPLKWRQERVLLLTMMGHIPTVDNKVEQIYKTEQAGALYVERVSFYYSPVKVTGCQFLTSHSEAAGEFSWNISLGSISFAEWEERPEKRMMVNVHHWINHQQSDNLETFGENKIGGTDADGYWSGRSWVSRGVPCSFYRFLFCASTRVFEADQDYVCHLPEFYWSGFESCSWWNEMRHCGYKEKKLTDSDWIMIQKI